MTGKEYLAKRQEFDALDGKPYKIIIFTPDVTDEQYNLTDNIDDIDEDTIDPKDIELYVICRDKDELIGKWTELYEQYEGSWYYVKGNNSIIVGGAMDAYDLDVIDEIEPENLKEKTKPKDIEKD